MTDKLKHQIDDIKNLLSCTDIKNIDKILVTEDISKEDIIDVVEYLSNNDKEKIYAAKLIYRCCKNATSHITKHMGVQNLFDTIEELQKQLPLSIYFCLLMFWYNDTSTKPSKKAPIYEIKQCISNCQKQDVGVLLYLLHFQELYDLLVRIERDANFESDLISSRPACHLVADTFAIIEQLLFKKEEWAAIQKTFYIDGHIPGGNDQFKHILDLIYKYDEYTGLKPSYIKAKFWYCSWVIIFAKENVVLLQKHFEDDLIEVTTYVEYLCKCRLLNKSVIDKIFEIDSSFEILYDYAKQYKKYIKSLKIVKELK